MSQSAPVQKLPNEVVHMILSYFNPVQLTKLELVCQQWHEVSRSRETLWRDALCDTRLIELSKQRDPFLHALLERGGRKLTDLAIEIDISKCDLNCVRRLCKILEASDVRNLWLEIMPGVSASHSQRRYDALIDRYLKALGELFVSIGNCSYLQSLHIETYGVFGERLPSAMMTQPIANCKLERLSLKCLGCTALFENGLLFKMLSKARVIQLEYEGGAISEENAVKLLDMTKETLEDCHLDIIEQIEPSKVLENKTIVFPKLLRLFISIVEKRQDDVEEGAQPVSVANTFRKIQLQCPKLRLVYFEGKIPHNLYENLLTEDIEAIYFTALDPQYLPDTSLLRKCTTLERIIVQNVESMPYIFIHHVLTMTSQANIKEFIVDDDERYHANHIVQMIKRRQEDPNAKDIELTFLQGKPTLSRQSLNWLIGNNVGFFHAHPYLWEKVMKCSFEEIKDYIDFVLYYSRSTPLLDRRDYTGVPICGLY
ncbi:uncharacterized protein FA14DRAFT_67724 [Meira miltonrushii]|uniref:F-box domain-containing protein n=1 Tax=Meira miltonrushii TaxID=1280837 RepID=A0A316V911_9BASI|nr:uncharacterized protein FA14DRAFT_67724 [Meira miltonrushii]PWN34016.1 hypothetical protein FA14DRAFT_67724 [Meira miltonrushii]